VRTVASTVTDVDVRLLSAEPDEVIAMSFGVLARRTMALIQVRCDDGSIGYGESWTNYPPWAGIERRATIRHGVAPLLIGADGDDVPARQNELVTRLEPLGRQWGATGPICQAISGADIALWDRLGRARGASIAQLCGGRVRTAIPAYASSLGPSRVAEQAAECRARSFGLVKLKVGFGPDTDRANLLAARAALGQDTQLAVDANQRWTLDDALEVADALRDADVVWVEEPLVGNALDDIERFHRRSGLPVALGENLYLRSAFEQYLRSPAVAVVQPDVSKSGGVTELLAICAMAAEAGTAVMPHLYGGAPAYAATLQLAACCPAIEGIEYDVRSNPLRDPLLLDAPTPVAGVVTIPDGPGLGIEIDPVAVEHVAEPEPVPTA